MCPRTVAVHGNSMEADVSRESGCGHQAGGNLLCKSGLWDRGSRTCKVMDKQQLSHRAG